MDVLLGRRLQGARGRRIRFVEGKGAARVTIDHGIRCVEPIVTGRIEAPPDRVAFAIRRRVSGSQPSRLERWVRGLDLYLGFEELDGGEDDPRAEFPCPFCSEDFDIVGLCCHIDDEHPVEAKNGVCPVCAASIGLDLVGHLTTQHGNFFKISFSFSIGCYPFFKA
ncbi:hypothetical protein MUK42_02346 [Musa troglodytarum]|uniref:Di19 zinc-binding domain-containing protein n=1 Tax=Musa troglodytarum TaxID=320322 RepID=A0A9E7JG40_9LILI|nr:hypothetical protein MUK42_02346 [Musa troglodytarum]